MAARLKHLGELASLREQLAAQARAQAERARERAAAEARRQHVADEFSEAVKDVKPLATRDRVQHAHAPHPPQPRSRRRDDAEVLAASVTDDFDADALLEADETLSYRAPGIGPEVLRKLRRGEWKLQAELDLHGHRVEDARQALPDFLREATRSGLRCVRVVHGKGLGSAGKVPVLKDKVRRWLAQRDEVIAFCQARSADGGAGAVIVLLRPTATGGG